MSEPTDQAGDVSPPYTMSRREVFYTDLGYELEKKSLDRQLDALQKLITLNVSLLGGAMLFLKEDTAPAWARAISFAALLISLGFSLYGARVIPDDANPDEPAQIEWSVGKVLKERGDMLDCAMMAMWIGLAVAAIGTVIFFLTPKPPVPQTPPAATTSK